MIVELRLWHRCTRNTPGPIRLGHISTSPVTTLRSVSPMSCALTLIDYNTRSRSRSKYRNPKSSLHRGILSYPARFAVLLRRMNMEPRSWVADLVEKLEDIQVGEESRERGGYDDEDGYDDEEWSNARPTGLRNLRKELRSISTPRHDGRGRSSRCSPSYAETSYPQELSRSPPPRSHKDRSGHWYEPTDRSPSPCRPRHRQQTPGPSSPRRDSSGLNDRDISPEHGALPEHSLRREKGRSVTKPGLSRQFSGPGLEPITPAPSSRYLDASYTQSSRSRGTPVTNYHQDLRPELPSTPSSRSRGPNTERRESKAAQPVGRSFTNNSTESSRLRRTTSQPRRRTSTELMMKHDPWINSDSGEVYRPYFMSKDQAESSELQSCFRGRQARPGSKGLKVELIESQKDYTVIDPRLPRKKPKRTELSTPRLGREDQFTDLAHEFWEEDVIRARGEAGYARSRAEFLHNYAHRNWAERLILKIL